MSRRCENDVFGVTPVEVTLGEDKFSVGAEFMKPSEESADLHGTPRTKAEEGDRPPVVDATHELRELGLVRAIAAARKAARPDYPDLIDWDSPLVRIGVAAEAEVTLRQVPDVSGQERVLLELSRQIVRGSLNIQFPRTYEDGLKIHVTSLGLDLVDGSDGSTEVAIFVGADKPLMATPEQADHLIDLLQASDISSSPEA